MKTSGIYGLAAGTGPGPSQSVLQRKSGTPDSRVALPRGKRRARGPNRWRRCQATLCLSRPGEVVGGVHAGRHSDHRNARSHRRDESSRRRVRRVRHPGDEDSERHSSDAGWRPGATVRVRQRACKFDHAVKLDRQISRCARGSPGRSFPSQLVRRRDRLPPGAGVLRRGSPQPAPARARAGTPDRRCRG
jgi:hypothetical protein